MTLRPVGDRGLLVELPGLPEVLSVQSQLQAHPADGQVDVVAAACTVLVTVQDAAHLAALAERLRTIDPTLPVQFEDTLVTIEVQYDGEDLAEVARRTGLSEDAVVAAHSSRPWTASFGGFAPGFAYLTGGDPRLEVPRRDSPRTAVPAGSVALAGTFSAVYPRESPGGWQLIGRTDAVLWDTHREQPALVRPGNRVLFVPIRDRVRLASPAQPAAPGEEHAGPAGRSDGSANTATRGDGPAAEASRGDVLAQPASRGDVPAQPASRGDVPAAEGSPDLAVVHPGLASTLQDLGRPGLMSLGVAGAGALDRASARQANRLVGNHAGAAVIESLNGGLMLEAGADQVLAVTGADVGLTIAMVDGREREPLLCAPFLLRTGEVLRQSVPAAGLRSYTAVRGGFAAAEVLGSRSTDSMSGLGPEPLAPGTPLAVATPVPANPVGDPESPRRSTSPEILRVRPGPRDDWFGTEGLELLCSSGWTVTAQSNRIGLRLDGPALQRTREGELPSEGTVRGALQVPPSGLPVLFLADHPVTGGYPVIAVVVSSDLDRAAQLPPGSTVRFRIAGS